MTAYRAAFASATPANAAAYATFNSATRRAKISEIKMSLATAVLSRVRLGTPANQSTPPVVSTSITPVGDPADIVATARVGTAWSTAPTAPTVFEGSAWLAAVIGSGWDWVYPPGKEITLQIAGWRVLWNDGGSTAGQVDFDITYDE